MTPHATSAESPAEATSFCAVDRQVKMEETQPNSISQQPDKSMPIAIVGMGCRCPGDATNPENLWRLVSEAREAWSPTPMSKYSAEAFYHPDSARNGTSNIRGGHYLTEDQALFDAPFFSLTSNEAAVMDPQQRLLLEICYEAIENAGIPMDRLVGSDTSCFVGSFCRDFTDIQLRDTETLPVYQATGAGPSLAFLSNRLSYFFDLKGPSVTVDTACSASLVALHLACQTIRSGESKTAIVGGSNVIISHEIMITMNMMRFLSPDGRCYSFDHRANGYARGEGVACIVLKSLEDAIKDGDTIRAVIRQTGVNQDGRTAGITLPSKEAQQTLIESVYNTAGLDPVATSYVEAHGTGTPAGDPIEASALAKVFSPGRRADRPLRIGSIKSNMGHLEGCSGLASLVKTVLMLENDLILPSRNFEKGNPHIPFEDWKLKVPTSTENWDVEGVRRASVNSFGYGGTNAHAIIDDALHYLHSRGLPALHRKTSSLLSESQKTTIGNITESAVPTKCSLPWKKMFTLSAFDEKAGKEQARNIAKYLEERRNIASAEILDDLAFTLNERRTALPWKTAISTNSIDNLILSLKKEDLEFSKSLKPPTVAFVFTGQGAQWSAMGLQLIPVYPVFRQSLERSSHHLQAIGASWNLFEELSKNSTTSRLGEAAISQPLCTALQIALVDLLASFNIRPIAVTGHSSGEIASAYTVGALTREDSISVAYFRGKVSATVKPKIGHSGAMMVVGIAKVDAQPLIQNLKEGKVVVACENSPTSITVSGDESAISELLQILKERNIFARRLAVEVAYHSHHMKVVADDYLHLLHGLKTQSSNGIQFFSSVTGEQTDARDLSARYWVANMVSEVKFSDALRKLCLEATAGKKRRRKTNTPDVDMLIEVGPHSALAGPIQQTLQQQPPMNGNISYGLVLARNTDAIDTILKLVGQLHMRGAKLSLRSINCADGDDARVLVDLPPYSWNHSMRLWEESRLSRTYRLRKHPRNDLLGVIDKNSNALEPRWRNIIRPSEIPWIRDHKVQSNIVYPAAGYVTMAIEAAHQRALERSVEVSSFTLREITIGTALLVPEYQHEVETLITLRPYNEGTRSTSDIWDEFCIFSVTEEDTWTQHCRGLISAQKSSGYTEVDGGKQARADAESYVQLIHNSKARTYTDVSIAELYENLRDIGLDYGPTFANLTSLKALPYESVGTICISETAAGMPEQFEFPLIMHPSTLDSCFHPLFSAIAAAEGPLKTPMVPTHIERIVVSRDITKAGKELEIYANAQLADHRQHKVDILVFKESREVFQPVINIHGLTCTKLSDDRDLQTKEESKKLCYQMNWRADVDFMSPKQVEALCADIEALPGEVSRIEAIERAGYYCMEKALKFITPQEAEEYQGHHKKLYACMKSFTKAVEDGSLPLPTTSWINVSEEEKAQHLAQVSTQNDEGSLLCHVGQRLSDILRQKVDVLSIMMEGDRLNKYYANNVRMSQNYKFAARYIDLLAHQNPHLNILEIGAGTGGCTFPVLEALGGINGTVPRFSNYEFTDISTGFFESSSKKTLPWKNLVQFRKLDIEKDPVKQGFNEESYDLIIAANVLHATSSIERTVKHVRKLLKRSGKLCLVELTRERLMTSTVFGCLPGWWTGEEPSRQKGPLITEDEWHALLQKTGFSGVDAVVWDIPNEAYHQGSMMISSAISNDNPQYNEVQIVTDERTPENLVARLESSLKRIGVKTSVSKLCVSKPNGRTSIVLVELARPFLQNPSEEEFACAKKLVLDSKAVLWVVRGASVTSEVPTSNMVTGLARTVRSESGSSGFIVLDLDPKTDLSDESSSEAILDIFRSKLSYCDNGGAIHDVEYAQRDGHIKIPRLVEDASMNKFIAATTENNPSPKEQPFVQPGRALTLEIESPGLLDTIRFVDDKRMNESLAVDEVEIEIKASGLNFHDVMMAMGQIKLEKLGCECAGIVSAVGSAVVELKPGDRVVTYGHGTFSNYLRQEARAVQLIPDGMPMEIAATLPIIYCTAYQSVFVSARLQQGETCLIHAASGGLGQALIMLCQMIGVEIFLTCGTLEKKDFLIKNYNIPEDHIFSSRDSTFASGVMRITKNRGVDVIMNSVAGDALRITWECIAPFGRFIELGKRDFGNNTRLEMSSFAKNVSFSAIDFIHLCDNRPGDTAKLWAAVMDLIRNGSLKPPQPVTVFGMAEIEKALRTMQAGKHIGKLVVMPKKDEVIMALPHNTKDRLLRKDVSYLLVGGLGGIGCALATWMIQHGARNIMFASRSGLARQSAQDTIKHLETQGTRVKVYSCDISDAKQLENLLSQSKNEMPPVRGVVQGAMVLKDALFQNMTLAEYNATTRPKVDGTWNLHNLLPKDLDFFIMLSSSSGIIGNVSQAQYAAASTFLDAFADYRNTLGLPAVSLDLGVILNVGYVAENEKLMKALEKQDFDGTSEQELLAMIQYAIAHQSRGGQKVTGLGTWRSGGSHPAYSYPLFSHFRRMFAQESTSRGETTGEQGIKVRDALKTATSISEAAQKACHCIIAKMSSLLMIAKDEISASKSMSDYGIDSLVAVEMRNWIFREMDCSVSILELMANNSLSKLSAGLVKKSKLLPASVNL